MRFKLIAMASFFILVIVLMEVADWFWPGNYDECILKSMKGVTSDIAADFIAHSCSEKFKLEPKKKLASRPLTNQELDQLDGKASLRYGISTEGSISYEGTIFNGNSNVTVAEITIQVTTTMGGKKASRLYTDDVFIRPGTTAAFNFNIARGDKGADYSWELHGAKGYNP